MANQVQSVFVENMASLLGRILSPQSHWTQADLYDAVFTLRIILAGGLGLIFGLGSIEGLYAFLTYVHPSARDARLHLMSKQGCCACAGFWV